MEDHTCIFFVFRFSDLSIDFENNLTPFVRYSHRDETI